VIEDLVLRPAPMRRRKSKPTGRKSKFFRKEIQAFPEGNPNLPGRKSKLNPSISFAESSLFNNLRRPSRHFSFLKPIPALWRRMRAGAACSPKGRSSAVFVFVSGSSCPFQASEGLAPFSSSRTLRRGLSPTWRPRSLMSAERESGVHGTSPGAAEKTGRSIRCPARIRPLHKEPDPVFEPRTSGRAPALHASRVSHDACLRILSLPFRSCDVDAAAFRRAR
jgi:hypothetical protein